MRVINAVGARPNFVKIAPIIEEMKEDEVFDPILVHTGQHYDFEMSRAFFRDLKLAEPDVHLETGPGSQAEQTGQIMIRFERVLLERKPDLVLVVGDVNSTLACALASSKLHIPVAHVEAGLRSFDRRMPEEINRLLTDAISDYLFVTERSGEENLRREGISEAKVFFVGNVMIDTLLRSRERASRSSILSELGIEGDEYGVMTLHRPENVDSERRFTELLSAAHSLSRRVRIVYPVHPRARRRIDEFRLEEKLPFLRGDGGLLPIQPASYLNFMKLLLESSFVLTDSGGIQEETTILGIQCLTLRDGTERPVTVQEGTNRVVGTDPARIVAEGLRILDGYRKEGRIPRLWDGQAARRIVQVLRTHAQPREEDD